MQIPDPKFDLGQEVSTHSEYRFKVGLRTYYEATGWHYQEKANYTAYTERELILKVDCPFPTGSRVCHLLDPNKIYLVDGTLLKFGTTTTQVSDWSRYVLAPKFKMGDKLRHPVHGVFTVSHIYWFTNLCEKGVWAYNDNFEYNCTKVTSPFEPGTRVACKNYPAKVGKVAENYDILIDLSAPKDVAGQVIPSHIVEWDCWALEPKYTLPLAVQHKQFPGTMGYATVVEWKKTQWQYSGAGLAGIYEENVIDLNAEISKIRREMAGDINITNKKIIDLFLRECKND